MGWPWAVGKALCCQREILPPRSWWLTRLDLLALCQMLEFSDDGAGRQVVESLAPHVSVLCVPPLQRWRLQLEAHFPLHALVGAQAFDQSLAQHRAWSSGPAGIGLLLGLSRGLQV